jgi:hypothetical protein
MHSNAKRHRKNNLLLRSCNLWMNLLILIRQKFPRENGQGKSIMSLYLANSLLVLHIFFSIAPKKTPDFYFAAVQKRSLSRQLK